ncbi:MAG: hypothetical protein HY258_10745, partial [Chloroflexi bacterium]|nr:hypothetical protein [Chloroflexota bacterium]
MSEPEFIGEQRTRLRAFRQAIALRKQAEADAENRRQALLATADAARNELQRKVQAEVGKARTARIDSESALSGINLSHLLTAAQPNPITADPQSVPEEELSRSVLAAAQALSGVRSTIDALQQWRRGRRLGVAFACVALLSLGVTSYVVYQAWHKEQLYQSAVAAINAGQWEKTRTDLQQLAGFDINYRDAPTLLRESYYQPAVALLQAENWESARSEFQKLLSLDKDYKDAQVLLRESCYRSAVAFLQAENWEPAQAAFQNLLSLDKNDKDAQTLLRESYYRSAVAFLQAENWESARSEFQKLLSLDKNYKDAPTLLRESYYRPAIAAIRAGQWDAADKAITSLISLDLGYKDVLELIAAHPELI